MRHLFVLILLTFATTVQAQEVLKGDVYAGGVEGIESMLRPTNHDEYRRKGGGLFIHNSGWAKLNLGEKRQLLRYFKDKPIAIEIGYNFQVDQSPMAQWLHDGYLKEGIVPHFVAVNIFQNGHVPTVKQFRRIHTALKNELPEDSLVVPIFEFANFGKHKNCLISDCISKSRTFKEIIKIAGGYVIDVPPIVFMRREPAYKTWVLDALRYGRRSRTTSIIIISPDKSRHSFMQHTRQFLSFLRRSGAEPEVVVVENYVENKPRYLNKVGNEDNPYAVLGVARQIVD